MTCCTVVWIGVACCNTGQGACICMTGGTCVMDLIVRTIGRYCCGAACCCRMTTGTGGLNGDCSTVILGCSCMLGCKSVCMTGHTLVAAGVACCTAGQGAG